jgi:hypothetical protein
MRMKHCVGLAVCALGLYSLPGFAQTNVLPGYDLFESTTATTFQGTPFEGVPIGSYNFGGAIGVQNTDLTDTIVQRLSTASVASTPNTAAAIPIQMDVLQLESTVPTTLGGLGPLGIYYITTQSQDGDGPASTGTMTITFATPAGGTFTSSLDVFFDVHYGALNGPVVAQQDLVLSNAGDAWGRIPTPGEVLINGANNLLDGADHNSDFFVAPPLIESHPTGAQHVVTEAGVPEPATMGIVALVSMAALSRRRNRATSI